MQYTPNYNLTIGEGTDVVNPLTQIFPNFSTIDSQMKSNENAGVGTATEVTTGTVHAITRANTNNPVFRFTATSDWSSGDTMTVDGTAVSVHTTSGQAPDTGVYVIGAEVLCILNGTLVTMYATKQNTVDSVYVTADGVKTEGALLNELFALIDTSKITKNAMLHHNYFYPVSYSDATLILCATVASVSYSKIDILGMNINASNSLHRSWELKTTGNTVSDLSSNVPGSGTVFRFYY